MAENSSYSCSSRRGRAVCQTEGFDPICIHCGETVLGRMKNDMMIHVMNDVFRTTPNRCIIVQQVNCMGKMNAGLAKAIRTKYPEVYEHYMAEFGLGLLELGYTSYLEVEPNIYVANMCSQYNYGRTKRHTDYNALRACLEDVRMMATYLQVDVVIPHRLGCGLAGGDWDGVVGPMIDEIFKGSLVCYIFEGGEISDENEKE